MNARELGVALGDRDQGCLDRIEIELDDLENGILRSGFRPLLIGFAHAVAVGRLPLIHRDPFDRMLIAQAGVEQVRIISHD